MNEQQNTALVQKLYEAFGKGDLQTILNHLADDVDWSLEGPEIIPFAGKRKGIAQVTGFFEALATTLTDPKLTIEVFVAQGDVVATRGRFGGTVKATGKSLEGPIGHFFTIRNGKVSHLVDFGNTAAMAAAYQATSAASN